MAKRTIGYVIILTSIALFAGACSLDQPTPTLPVSTAAPHEATPRFPTATPVPSTPTPQSANGAPSEAFPAEEGNDIHEPNDTLKQAAPLWQLAANGLISPCGDVDWFLTPATYGGYLLDFGVRLGQPRDRELYQPRADARIRVLL